MEKETQESDIFKQTIPTSLFNQLKDYIYENLGIKINESKKTMLEGRLRRRVRALGYSSFQEYCNFVFSDNGREELINLIDAVTTNKTDFFRESQHFDYLSEIYFPQWYHSRKNVSAPLKIWSAGCSSGEEPYTLAIVLDMLKSTYRDFDYMIYASDVSTQILQKAINAVYKIDTVNDIEMKIKKKYFLKSKDPLKNIVRVVPELRRKVEFKRVNFMDDSFMMPKDFDIIFCRNVIIYFDRHTQEKLMNKFAKYTKNGGYLFIGHSETLHGMNIPYNQVKPTIYKKSF